MSSLTHLFAEGSIALDISAANWREAITHAGKLLENAGHTTASYTAAMIETVERNGPYIVLAPGFALPHAQASAEVYSTGLSLCRLSTPVAFGHPTNDPVTLVIALAAADKTAHMEAISALSRVLTNPTTRATLDSAATPQEVRAVLEGVDVDKRAAGTGRATILTVCGNGLGTSLFLKNTLEDVLDAWGWGPFVTVEATDTISAKGKAADADCILTSGEIARTLGDVGIPVQVVTNFSSPKEVDAALRSLYDV